MITVDVEREEHKKRYVLHFKQSRNKFNWFMFLEDKTFENPALMKKFVQRIVQEVQSKSD